MTTLAAAPVNTHEALDPSVGWLKGLDVPIMPGGSITIADMHGDELLAATTAVHTQADSLTFNHVNYVNFNPDGGRTGTRYRPDGADPNRVFNDLDPRKPEDQRALRMLDTLQAHPQALSGILLDLHNTHTSTPPFVIVSERDLLGRDVLQRQRTLELIDMLGIERVVTMPDEMVEKMLIGRGDLFEHGRALVEWPISRNNDGARFMFGAVQRILEGRPAEAREKSFYKIIGTIPVGTLIPKAVNFKSYAWDADTGQSIVPIMYAHPGEEITRENGQTVAPKRQRKAQVAGTYADDENAGHWGYNAIPLTSMPL